MNVQANSNQIAQARVYPSEQDIFDFLEKLATMGNVPQARLECTQFLALLPPERVLEVASAMSHVYPFFVPHVDDEGAKNLAIGISQFAELVMRGRLTAGKAKQTNILVACAPKSASTFVAAALSKGFNAKLTSLACPTTGYSSSILGANLREQELDELALLRNGLGHRNYVAQHHVRCTPYLARQLELYGVKPIITIRNFFDCLVSFDDMMMQSRPLGGKHDVLFFDDGLPSGYGDMPQDERLGVLVDTHAVWYAQFLVSWQLCEKAGLVKPLWISYEDDFLGDKLRLAERIVAFVGDDRIDPQVLADQLADRRDGAKHRLNKGITGRGQVVSGALRERALGILRRYCQDADMSPLTGI
jgi:hypothetical protein